MSKIVVCGGLGFVGSHLVERLVELGHNVTVIDDMSTGSFDNLKGFFQKILFYSLDVCDPQLVNFFKDVDYVFHLANPACGTEYERHPVEATTNAIQGFMNVLESAREVKVKKVVYVSSASTYGVFPILYLLALPFSVYGETRRFFERVAYVYSKYYGLSTVGVRLFSVYGPRSENKQGYASVVNQFVKTMMRGGQPEIWGNGKQRRDYVYVDDVVGALIASMEHEQDYMVEVGHGKSYSYNELVEIINGKLGVDIKPKYVEKEFSNYVEETRCMRKDFTPKISLEEGVGKLIEYYRGEG